MATGEHCKYTLYFVFSCLYLKNELGDAHFLIAGKWSEVQDQSLQKSVCHLQEDVEARKSVHVVGYANPNPTKLFIRPATLFVTGHLVFGFSGLAPRL